jgi:glycerophosphoryl diester phosphodiesterase
MPSGTVPSGTERPPFLDHAGPIIYAHRGGGEEHPENSMAAFAHAVSLGFRYLETDARLSADGVLIALHDDRLDRVSDGRGLVSEHSAAHITSRRLRHADGTLSDERIPALDDVIAAFPAARFNLDAKDARTVGPLGDLIERFDLLARCCVGAFSDERLDRLRGRFGAQLCTALGPREVARLRVASIGMPMRRPVGHVAQVPMVAPLPLGRRVPPVRVPVVDRRFLAVCRRFEVPVHIWTVNDTAEMAALLDRGIDGFMTDRPSAAVELLRSRGQWPTAPGEAPPG